MPLVKKFSKNYALLLATFTFSLFIPTLLYAIQKVSFKPFYKSSIAYTYPHLVKYSYKWPNALPSLNAISDTEANDNIFKKIDQKYCGKDKCRFILPVVITEQESKAQMHFRNLAYLAGKLGRTIVLPNVYNSHLGACLPHAFDFYYDKSWLESNRGKFSYITMNDFKSWIAERHDAGVVPTGQEIYIQGSKQSRLLHLPHVKNCFGDSLDFSGRPTVSYQFVDPGYTPDSRQYNITSIYMSILSDQARQHEYLAGIPSTHGPNKMIGSEGAKSNYDNTIAPPVDVINLFFDRRQRFIEEPSVNTRITYNKKWIDIAEKISAELQPYIAIHWRMERLEPLSNLLPCAKNLVKKIQDLDFLANSNTTSHTNSPNIFLLTDYPHLLDTPEATPESNSFKKDQVKPQHHNAIKYLYQHLNVSLTSVNDGKIPFKKLPKKNWHIIPIDSGELPLDRSVLGLVDKLVAINAQWFFAGRPGVCAKASSFTGLIERSRQKIFEKEGGHIISPYLVFDMKPLRKGKATAL